MDGRLCFVEHFSTINDPRIERTKKHKLIDILIIGVIGMLCGADGWEDIQMIAEEKEEWLRGFLELPNGIPSHDTISRVFGRVSPKEFERCFVAWMKDVANLTDGEIVAIDGKCVRRSHDKANTKSAIHMVSAWAKENGVVLGQVKVNDKSNEITAIPELLKVLDLNGCIVTIDAMGCQKEIAEKIISQEADYVFGLKGNQGNTLGVVSEYFDMNKQAPEQSHQTVDNDHGRLETREYTVAPAAMVPDLLAWTACNSIAMVSSTREINGVMSNEKRYYISSLSPVPQNIARAIRGHWGIENSLHWVLDMTFNEDLCRIRADNSSENAVVLRHMALNLLKTEQTLKGSLRKKRLKCCMSNAYLAKVLFS